MLPEKGKAGKSFSKSYGGKPDRNPPVANFRLTGLAEKDMESIAEYTLKEWGEKQNHIYLDEMESRFHLLANQPGLGRKCDRLGSGLLRSEVGRHVAFFRQADGGIVIIRILHQSMLPDGFDLE